MLALRTVTHRYGNTTVLDGLSLDVQPKDYLCIVGNGGSGKSTILRLFARMEDPTSGVVDVDGVDLRKVPPAVLQLYRRRLGLMFQEPMLIEHATVAENIALPLELFGAPAGIVRRATADLLKRLNLESVSQRLAGELSMSERSLTGIARALIGAPMIVIADEPLQHLDAQQSQAVQALFANMRKRGTTIILLSRDSETADVFGARTLTLSDGKISGASTKSPARSTALAETDTHRIFEKTSEDREQTIADEPFEERKAGDGGKKIRITSIGSGL